MGYSQKRIAGWFAAPARTLGTILAMVTLGALPAANAAFAQDDASWAKLMGRWQQSDSEAFIWELQDVGGSIHVTNFKGNQTVIGFECNTVGKECAVERGRHAKVSLWFNGGKLVEVETKGSQVVKRRFAITAAGDTMELETIPIFPAGKTETAHFKRVSAAAAK